jgi:hypothetical protein
MQRSKSKNSANQLATHQGFVRPDPQRQQQPQNKPSMRQISHPSLRKAKVPQVCDIAINSFVRAESNPSMKKQNNNS